MNIKEILKFLFPEYQIFSAWRNRPQIAQGTQQAPSHQTIASKIFQTKNSKQKPQEFSTIYTRTQSNSSSASKDNINTAAFDTFIQDLKKEWIGSEHDINAFFNAFKRPYLGGSCAPKPKNAILLLGSEGRGKHFAINCITKLLCQKKIFTSTKVEVIDLNQYAGDSSGSLFLSDLYSSLTSKGNIVVFDAPEKAGAKELNIIQQLLEKGICKLDKRYVSQNGMLMESTGVLLSNPISEISADNKFFIFISNQTQNKVLSTLGNKISEHIGDIIVLDPFSKDQLEDIAFSECQSLSGKCYTNLHLDITFDDALVNALSGIVLESTGIKGLKK